MNVLTLAHGWYPDDINSKLNFEEFASADSDEILLIGIPCTEEPHLIEHIKKFNRTVYINLEHPCTLYGPLNKIGLNPLQQQTLFDEVYTICPYTAKWINSMNVGTKAIAMPYMHNLKYDKFGDMPKPYDVAYAGLIHHEEIAGYISAMSQYRYIFTTIPAYNRVHTVDYLATHKNIPNVVKWELLSAAKMSVIQNNLYLKPDQITLAKRWEKWNENEALSHLDIGLLPQLKSRTVESALCKSLLLVKQDPWNVIEYWFEPDKDFIYFKDERDLNEKIIEISTHYDDYKPIIENAYNKVITYYNTKYIFERIKEGLEIL
tara:strand:+ start:4809 stop:5765 length:957 start_codon:yes stop_codon:yes gene_type:complete